MGAWEKGKVTGLLLLSVELPAVVELDVIVWHGSLFMQIVVTQGLSSIHVVEVELDCTLAPFACCLEFPTAANIKTIEQTIIIPTAIFFASTICHPSDLYNLLFHLIPKR